jgi:hypothetical protein
MSNSFFSSLSTNVSKFFIIAVFFFLCQTTAFSIQVKGTIQVSGTNKVKVFGKSNAAFTSVFDHIQMAISLPNLGGTYPDVEVTTSFLSSLPIEKWFVMAPFVQNGRVFYTFVGVIPDTLTSTWAANQEYPMLEFTFSGGSAGYTNATRELNDLTAQNGGTNGQAYWYVQVQNPPTVMDITNYPTKFYGTDFYNSQTANSYSRAANVLPIELITFGAKKAENEVVLNWKTASEKNTERFEIERSLEGRAWKSVGTLAAAGNSEAELNYELADVDALKVTGVSQLFYRLRTVDADGSFQLSGIETVKMDAVANDAALFPTTNSGQFQISINEKETEKGLRAEIFSAKGQLVGQSELTNSVNNVDLNQPNGLYLVIVRDGTRVVKQFKMVVAN